MRGRVSGADDVNGTTPAQRFLFPEAAGDRGPRPDNTQRRRDPGSSDMLRTLDAVCRKLDAIEARLGSLEARLDTMAAQSRVQATDKEFYTTAEVAVLLDRRPYTVREWCRLRRIHAVKCQYGRGEDDEWRVSHAELQRIRNEGLLPPNDYR